MQMRLINNQPNPVNRIRIQDICADKRTDFPPTLEEVAAYCKRNNGVDPQKWYDYSAKGWIGKNKMKDWKAQFGHGKRTILGMADLNQAIRF